MSLYDYLCGNVPGGLFLLIVFLVVVWFIIWFVYHYTKLMDKRYFYRWMVGMTLLSIFTYGTFWVIWKPPSQKVRIAFIPQDGYSTANANWQDYAFQFLLYHHLVWQLPAQKWLVYSPNQLYRIANQKILSDSLAREDFFKKLACNYLTCFSIDSAHQEVKGQVFTLADGNSAFHFQIQFHSLKDAASKLSEQFEQNFFPSTIAQKFPAVIPDDDFWRIYTLGQFAIFKGDTLDSEKYFRQCCRHWPQAVWGYCALAHLNLQVAITKKAYGGYVEDNLGEIAGLLHQAMELAPGLAWVHRLSGEYFIQRENWYQAEIHLKQCLRLNPNDALCYVALSRLHPSRYRDLGFLHEEALLKHAIFLDPTCVAAHFWLADYYYQRNQLDEAISQYHQLLALNPDYVDALMGLGKLYLQRRNFEQAQTLFHRVLEIEPANTQALYDLGIDYYSQGKLDSAVDCFIRVLKAPDVNPDAYLYLAYIHEKRENLTQAVIFLRRRIHYSRGPNDPFAEEARHHLVELLQKHPELLNSQANVP